MIPFVGCQSSHESREGMREAWQHPSAAVEHPRAVIVVQGPSPLLWRSQQSGTVHVKDTTSGAEVVAARIEPGTIVRVDEDHGVFANSKLLRPGPMAAGHSYSVTIDLDTSDSWVTGVQKARPPASQPAQQNVAP